MIFRQKSLSRYPSFSGAKISICRLCTGRAAYTNKTDDAQLDPETEQILFSMNTYCLISSHNFNLRKRKFHLNVISQPDDFEKTCPKKSSLSL